MTDPTRNTKPGSRELKRVQRAAVKYDAARIELEDAMRSASEAGHALRPIADASGFSAEWVRRIIGKASRS